MDVPSIIQKNVNCEMIRVYKIKLNTYQNQRNEAPSPLSLMPLNWRLFLSCLFSFLYSSGVVLVAISGKIFRRGGALRSVWGVLWKVSAWINIQLSHVRKYDSEQQASHSKHCMFTSGLYVSRKRITRAFLVLGGMLLFFCLCFFPIWSYWEKQLNGQKNEWMLVNFYS